MLELCGGIARVSDVDERRFNTCGVLSIALSTRFGSSLRTRASTLYGGDEPRRRSELKMVAGLLLDLLAATGPVALAIWG